MPTKVVIIAGAGRSGSTFLSQLLSQNDDCQNVGQIRHLPMSLGNDRVCSCGQILKSCDYWGAVAAKLVATYGAPIMTELKQGLNGFQKSAAQMESWSKPRIRKKLAASHARFLGQLADLYRFASAEAGGRTLIDSSKVPSIALALALAEDVEVFAINLVRDPRAVSASWAKLVRKPDILQKRCHNWNKRADQMLEFEKIPDVPFMRVKYEDFATNPRAMLEDIQAWAGLDQKTPFFVDDRSAEISWERTHLFPPANEEVLAQKATRIDIRPSDSWKSDSNRASREMAQEINFPRAVQIGYASEIV